MARVLLIAAMSLLFSSPTQAQDVISPAIRAALSEAQSAATVDGLEHAVCFDADDVVVGVFTGSMDRVTPDCDRQRTVTIAHTHPSGAGPSQGDMVTMLSSLYPNLDTSIILGADGMVTVMRGFVGRRPASEAEVAFAASRYILLTDIYRIADPAAPRTETWPMGRLCAGFGLTCHVGPFAGALEPINVQTLDFADDPRSRVFSQILRDAIASWILGQPTQTTHWADVGRIAESAPMAGAYLDVIFINDNGNFANSGSPFSSLANLTRETPGGLESLEVFGANDAPGELSLCVRTGWNLAGPIETRFISASFVRLTAGEFEIRCGSRLEDGVAKVFYQRLADGRVTFFPTREAMASGTHSLGSVPADTGCTQTPESLYRTCEGVSPDNYARIQPD